MFKLSKFKLLGLAVVLVALLAGSWVALQAAGKQNGITVKALNYDDRVRFVVESEKVSILRAEVFDLAGRRLFDSGPIPGKALDWTMTTETGERVAHGVYLYVITAWDSQGQLVKSQVGKLALVPGGVGLGQAPPLVSGTEGTLAPEGRGAPVVPLAYSYEGDWTVSGKLGVGTDTPAMRLDINATGLIANLGTDPAAIRIGGVAHSYVGGYYAAGGPARTNYFGANIYYDGSAWVRPDPSENTSLMLFQAGHVYVFTGTTGLGTAKVKFSNSGRVGIGTGIAEPSATLEVKGSTANLLVLKDPVDNTVFRVEKDGDVYADRSYNCGLSTGCFNAGTGADVAERIDVSEQVHPGDVVEIDPVNPGRYRKAQEPYSTRVAGIISTAPAITLGNNFDPEADRWEDSRPLLALAGRGPVKVTTENGPIKIGDFLTTSSTPGYAMRCGDLSQCTGAILGKALEPLEEGAGAIMIQVTLR